MKSTRLALAVVALALVVVPAPVHASGVIRIKFDDLKAPCNFIETHALSKHYSKKGVTFRGPSGNDGGAVMNECSNVMPAGRGSSSPNYLAFSNGLTLKDGARPIPPETITFKSPVHTVTLLAGSYFNPGHDLTMTAYSVHGTAVATTTTLTQSMAALSISEHNIKKVVLSTTATTEFAVDDLVAR